MEFSNIIVVLVVAGFVALAVAATIKLGRKKGAMRQEAEAVPPQKSRPKRETSEPAKKPSETAKAKQPVEAPKEEEAVPQERESARIIPFPVVKPLSAGLERTRLEGFVGRLKGLLSGRVALDDALLTRVEEVLLTSDIGVKTTQEILQALRTEFTPSGKDVVAEVLAFLKGHVEKMLSGLDHGPPPLPEPPALAVIMVVGVNGTGKTTTIGKIAYYYKLRGRKVLLGAGDTFRAAGTEQLQVWGERVGVPVVTGPHLADPGSVLFNAAKKAKEEGHNLLIADTAGRLHTNAALVDELKKVHRVLGKVVEGAPHEVLLVLDATMGQNAIRQAEVFRQAVKVTGIALAKLDGTAKGGVVLSIAKDMGIPIRFVGVGEKVQDLRPFDPKEFSEALFEGT